MHNLNDKMCPLMGKVCLLNGCTMFNERLDGILKEGYSGYRGRFSK